MPGISAIAQLPLAGFPGPSVSAGMRSLLAFWMGGVGSTPAGGTAGMRSMLASWMGGVEAKPAGGITQTYFGQRHSKLMRGLTQGRQ